MNIFIKWAEIEVINEEHAIKIIEQLEGILRDESEYFKWDYELNEEKRE